MAVYSYSRTSDIEVIESHGDIDALLEQESLNIHTYALNLDIQVNDSFVDNAKKWTENFETREAGIALLDRLENNDIILVSRAERIFSSCEDMQHCLQMLKLKQVKLHVIELGGDITDPDFSPSFSNMLEIFNKFEKRRSTERIKAVKQNQRDKGRFLGGSRPFGYMIHSNGRLIENPMEQRVLKKIIKMKQQGKSLRAISSEVSTPLIPVSFKTVQRLLKRNENSAATIRL